MRKLQIVLFTIFLCYGLNAQERRHELGLNVVPGLGNTVDLNYAYTLTNVSAFFLGGGFMMNNTMQGSMYKRYDGTSDWSSSGYYIAPGYRYTIGSFRNKGSYIVTPKIIFGYFDQEAMLTTEDPETGEDASSKIFAEGNFAALATDFGYTFIVSDRFHFDVGFQISLPFYFSEEMVSKENSILPGIGSFGNLKGILAFKIKL